MNVFLSFDLRLLLRFVQFGFWTRYIFIVSRSIWRVETNIFVVVRSQRLDGIRERSNEEPSPTFRSECFCSEVLRTLFTDLFLFRLFSLLRACKWNFECRTVNSERTSELRWHVRIGRRFATGVTTSDGTVVTSCFRCSMIFWKDTWSASLSRMTRICLCIAFA